MKAPVKLLASTALAAFAFASMAHALSITPETLALATGNQTSQAQIDAAIAPYVGASTLLYKQDQGGSESGSFASSYETVFANTPGEPSDATVTYVGGPVISPPSYLLVKDGNHDPSWYLFNLSGLGWNGMVPLEITGFWPNGGAISHVSIYGGSSSDIPGVPDGGLTMSMVGLALCGLAWFHRRVRVAS